MPAYIKDGTTPILAGLQLRIDNWKLVTYLQKSDVYRDELTIPRPPRLTDTTPSLAAQVYTTNHRYCRHHTQSNCHGISTGLWATEQNQHTQQKTTTSCPPARYARKKNHNNSGQLNAKTNPHKDKITISLWWKEKYEEKGKGKTSTRRQHAGRK